MIMFGSRPRGIWGASGIQTGPPLSEGRRQKYWRAVLTAGRELSISRNSTDLVLFLKGLIDMIKLSRMADYGMVLMVELARSGARNATAVELARATVLPQPTVSKLLKQLAAADLLTSRRGASGGYGLARDPADISVAEIISAVDGPIALTECMTHEGIVCEIEALCPTQTNWRRINDALVDALESVSLADMARPSIPVARDSRAAVAPAAMV